MDVTRTEWPYHRKLCGIRVGEILTAARIWLGHLFVSGMVRFALVVLARSHRPRWLRISVLVRSRAHFLRWGSLWPLLVWSSSCFDVVKGALFSLGLSLANFGVVFFLFWCGQGRTFFVGALFDPTISEHAQFPKERPSHKYVALLKVHQGSLLAHIVRSTHFWLCHKAILEVL
jgi:hypothetical protein